MATEGGASVTEPSNHLHRPTSAKTQDISHILSKQFGEQFIREAIDPQVVQNLRVSQSGSSDPYHEQFVAKLLEVVDERQRRMDRLSQLERSIMAAKARAMSADERLANKQQVGHTTYHQLGLPAPSSHFRSCLDPELLRSNGLIGPSDLVSRMPPPVPPPSAKGSSSGEQQQQQRQQQSRAKTASSSASAKRSRQSADNESARNWSATTADDLFDEESHMSEGSLKVKSAVRARSARQMRIEKLLQRRNLNWQEECSNEGRNEGRRALANMESRVQFLANPKFLLPMEQGGNGNLLTHKLDRNPADVRIFEAKPQKITFGDYEIGNVYELTLELRNISCSLRYIRVIPPRTKYFSLGLGQFPGEGEVAPGLSCKYSVSFAPDSLRDYEDEILVETQAGSAIAVRVEAKRPRPQLNIPSELHIGQCLVNGTKTVCARLQNEGGAGKFAILRADQWPETNLKRALQGSNSSSDGTFDIRPAYFELGRNEALAMEVSFLASEAKLYASKFVFVCDNCQVKEVTLKGEGQSATVSLLSLQGESEPAAGESNDAGASSLLRFDSLHPMTFTQCGMSLRNDTNVDMPFEWKVVKPFCLPPDEQQQQQQQLPAQRTLDPEAPFSVQPSRGILPAGAVAEFVTAFAPRQVGSYHSALHLLLLQVPVAPGEAGDLPAMQLQCRGECEPLQLLLQPAAVCLPGEILVGTTVRQRLQMQNPCRADVSFSWENCISEEFIVEVEPGVGCLQAGHSAFVNVCVTATKPGSLECTLLCRIAHMAEAVPLKLSATVRGLRVSVEQPDINFGLVQVGESVQRSVLLRNPLRLSCSWSCSLAADSELQLQPSSGQLAPLEEQQLQLKLLPTSAQQLNEIFRIDVDSGESSFVSAFADIQSPAVCLLDSHALADIADLFLEVQSAYTVQLYNQTKLPTQFQWQEAQGDGVRVCDVGVEPRDGLLQPRETKEIVVYTTPKCIGPLDTILLPCLISGQSEPLVLKLGGQMKGISVTLHCSEEQVEAGEFPSDSAAANQRVDFGSVPIHGVAKRLLHIRNDTSIRADFSVEVEFFKATPPETEIVLPMRRSEISASRRGQAAGGSLLTKTPNLADPKSKPYKHAFYDMCKTYLRENKGAAIHCSKDKGTLDPYSITTIELTAYTDMWGNYIDNLLISIDQLATQSLPMQLEVTGCPVEFTMTAGSKELEPILRFGSQTHCSSAVTRPVRLNNRCPFAVRLDWQLFNVESEDQQLLDFIVGFGREFPPIGDDGDELLPPIPGDTPPVSQRPPTGHLPDSPTSSAAPDLVLEADEARGGSGGDLAEAQGDGLKVMKVNVRPHDGRHAAAPFTVRPRQLTIPPESYDYVHVTFDSSSIDEVIDSIDFQSYLLAFMSLDEQRAQVAGKVQRGVGHAADQLRLDITGRIELPELDVDYNNDDGFDFYAAASDLLQDRSGSLQLKPEASKSEFATLRNLRDTPLSFSLSIKGPFAIRQPQVAASVQLVPRQTCLLELAFVQRSDMLQLLQMGEQQEEEEGVELVRNEETGERTLRFTSELLVQFANGSQQSLQLRANLKFGCIRASKSCIEFGVCMVGQRRQVHFTVTNFTAADSAWRAVISDLSETCDAASTLKLEPSEGLLEGANSCLAKNQTLIKVFFLPKHAEVYSAKILITGCLGEEPVEIEVTGAGSYDEQHKALFNE